MTELLNHWAAAWASFMGRGFIDATLLLAIVLLLWLPLQRRMPAQLGYCLFLLILLKLLIPVQLAVPGWLAYLSPRYSVEKLTDWATLPASQAKLNSAALPPSEFHAPYVPSEALPLGERGAPFPPPGQIPSSQHLAPPTAIAPPLSLTAILMLGWLAAVTALSIRFAWAQLRMQRLIRQSTPVDLASLPVDFHALRRLAGVRQPVCLVASPVLGVPAVWGLLRPRVVLPPDLLKQLTTNQLTWVLLHELAHIRRTDLLVALLQRLTQIVYFFNPAVWLANWLIDQQREYACDDAALAACSVPRRDCGQGFLRIVELANSQPIAIAPALGLFDGLVTYKTFIRSRLMRILDTRRPIHPHLSFSSALLLLALAALLLPQLQAQQERPQKAVAQNGDAQKGLSYKCLVIDKERQKGVAGARVTVQRMDSAQNDKIVAETKYATDAEGKFTLDIPAEQVALPGMYIQVLVEHGNYVSIPGIGYSLAMIRQNETLGERPFFERLELESAERITARVVDPDGRPVAGVKIGGFTTRKTRDQNQRRWLELETANDGTFRVNAVKGGITYLTIAPQNYAIVQRWVEDERGDLGEIRLSRGIRIRGRAVTVDGKPVAEVVVGAHAPGEDKKGLGSVVGIERKTLTDNDGNFVFDPLPPGEYSLYVGERTWGAPEPPKGKPVPGAFLSKTIQVREAASEPIEIRGVPHVRFRAQWLTSQGKKTNGYELPIAGHMDDQFWHGVGRNDADGAIDVFVPRGLRNVQINLTTNEHSALRHRLGPGKPLENQQYLVRLDKIEDDVDGFEIVSYDAPVVLVQAVDEAGLPIKDFQVVAKYAWLGGVKQFIASAGGSHVSFERQDDGRYRTSSMLPEEETTFQLTAKGYELGSETLKLKEGETKDLVVTLKKVAGGK